MNQQEKEIGLQIVESIIEKDVEKCKESYEAMLNMPILSAYHLMKGLKESTLTNYAQYAGLVAKNDIVDANLALFRNIIAEVYLEKGWRDSGPEYDEHTQEELDNATNIRRVGTPELPEFIEFFKNEFKRKENV